VGRTAHAGYSGVCLSGGGDNGRIGIAANKNIVIVIFIIGLVSGFIAVGVVSDTSQMKYVSVIAGGINVDRDSMWVGVGGGDNVSDRKMPSSLLSSKALLIS
jgi:hypothetical protein